MLLYPLIDPLADTASRRDCAEGYVVHLDALAWFGAQYVNGPEDAVDPRLALPRNDRSALPPTLVVTTEFDPLGDEGEEFAEQLRSAGIDTTAIRVECLVHAIYWASAAVPRGSDIHAAVVQHPRRSLHG